MCTHTHSSPTASTTTPSGRGHVMKTSGSVSRGRGSGRGTCGGGGGGASGRGRGVGAGIHTWIHCWQVVELVMSILLHSMQVRDVSQGEGGVASLALPVSLSHSLSNGCPITSDLLFSSSHKRWCREYHCHMYR